MEFNVSRAGFMKSKELVVSEGCAQVSEFCGDEKERRVLAAKLIGAAEDLLWPETTLEQFIGVEE